MRKKTDDPFTHITEQWHFTATIVKILSPLGAESGIPRRAAMGHIPVCSENMSCALHERGTPSGKGFLSGKQTQKFVKPSGSIHPLYGWQTGKFSSERSLSSVDLLLVAFADLYPPLIELDARTDLRSLRRDKQEGLENRAADRALCALHGRGFHCFISKGLLFRHYRPFIS